MTRHGFPMPRGGGQDLPPRRNALLGEGLPTRRTSEKICPARERSPRRRPPDTAHERKDWPRAGTRPAAKASRHGARAKGFAPRRNTPLGESLPTRRTSKRICPAQEYAPRRRPPDTARRRKNLPRAGTHPSAKASRHGARAKEFAHARTLSSAKASRHGARAKEFAPREKALLGEGLPTRRTSERICPAQERSPRRRPPDTAHERKDLCRGGSRSPHVPTNGGPPSTDGQPEKHPFGGVAPTACGRCRVHSPKKIRLLHETQLFYGESHVASPQIFSSFPSVGRCVARERNPVPPVAPHRGSEPRGLRRTGEMVRRFDAMCPRGSEWLPRGGNGWLPCGGRCGPSLRSFGERFHRRRCANPDACRGRRCSRAHDDLGQRAFRCSRPTFRHRRRSDEKTFGG